MRPMNFKYKATKIREAALMRRYPPDDSDLTVSSPRIIQDMHGNIITWYLPGILNDSRKVHLLILVRLVRQR